MRDPKPTPRPDPAHEAWLRRVLGHVRAARQALHRGCVEVADEELAAAIQDLKSVTEAK